MKKMYLAIFLIILIAVVFAGCLSFSNEIVDNTTDEQQNIITQQAVPTAEENTLPVVSVPESVPSGTDVPAATDAPAVPDKPTQPSGNNVPAPSGENEYDILRQGKFYMKGSMVEASGVTTPMEIAIGDDTVYMLSDFEGKDMGILVTDTMYMIYPEKKCYLELSKALLKMMGSGSEDLIDVESIKVFEGDPLSEADKVTEETLNGHKCKVYIFDRGGGSEKRIFMDGNKMIRFSEYNNGKMASAYDFDFISRDIPADKSAPPASYQKYSGVTGVMKFMTLVEGDTQQ